MASSVGFRAVLGQRFIEAFSVVLHFSCVGTCVVFAVGLDVFATCCNRLAGGTVNACRRLASWQSTGASRERLQYPDTTE